MSRLLPTASRPAPSPRRRTAWPRARDLWVAAAMVLATACGGGAATGPGTGPGTGPVTTPTPDAAPETAPEPVAAVSAPSAQTGPGGFPLPLDAVADERPGLSTATIKTFVVERGRDALIAEVRQLLADHGWTVTSEEVSPRGSVRLVVSKDGAAIKASVTGDDSRAAVIVTVPSS